MEILIVVHPEEYPADCYSRCAEFLSRLADGEWVSLRPPGEGPLSADGGDEAALLRDVSDALRDADVSQVDPAR